MLCRCVGGEGARMSSGGDDGAAFVASKDATLNDRGSAEFYLCNGVPRSMLKPLRRLHIACNKRWLGKHRLGLDLIKKPTDRAHMTHISERSS
mmetsp:Transcript_344/g.914  ORF Transcript_344/g.914 Transcript_344/m.914 type:complete len:93 (+) Transcript_344:200-478(+)